MAHDNQALGKRNESMTTITANSCALSLSKIKSEPRTLARARSRIVARILAAASNGISRPDLERRLSGQPHDSISKYLGHLEQSRLLSLVSGDCYETTPDGYRFLSVYEELIRASPRSRNAGDQLRSGYYKCTNCRPHPSFPSIPAITLHIDGVCLVCNNTSKKKT